MSITYKVINIRYTNIEKGQLMGSPAIEIILGNNGESGTVFIDVLKAVKRLKCNLIYIRGRNIESLEVENIRVLLRALKDEGKNILIETDGSIKPDKSLLSLISFWYVIPKLRAGARYKYNFPADIKNAYWLFIVKGRRDLNKVRMMYEGINRVNPERLIVMPDVLGNVSIKAYNRRLNDCFKWCKQFGYRVLGKCSEMKEYKSFIKKLKSIY